MSHRAVLLIAAVLGASSLGLTLSCSAPDPGEVTFIERGRSGDTTSGSSGDTSSSSSSSSSSTSSTSSSTSSTSSTGGPPTDAFAGAPAFVAGTNPVSSTNASHGTNPNPAGRDCLSCHNAANGNAPIWGFAGTLYDKAGAPVVGAEVRALDATGKPLANNKILYTDANGNFWSDDVNFVPLKVGVRNAAGMMQMSTVLSKANNDMSCQRSTCHNSPGGQAKISVN